MLIPTRTGLSSRRHLSRDLRLFSHPSRIAALGLAIAALLACAPGVASAQVCGDGSTDAGEACDDGNVLDGDCCSSACAIEPSGTVCRTSAGGCDPAETCDGIGSTCPADFLHPSGSICRSPAGDCDVSETCDGTSPDCPADAFSGAGTTCRGAAGDCDVAETCTGSAADCPADVLVAAGVACRNAAGSCDVAESCDGIAAACPADVLVAAGTTCNPSAGVCDVAETCTGSAAACPADVVAGAGAPCRAAASNCDVAETCDGTNVACPADALLPDGTSCNDGDVCSSASTCQAGTCTGTGATAGGQVCRPIAGPCDIAETCNGINATCPPDGYRPATATCRNAAGVCDLAELCSGTGVSCPADVKRTTECRVAASSCDVAEFCDGVGNHCPTNLPAPNGTFCADEGNPCTRDTCLNAQCAHTAGNTGALCRAALDSCDVPETCDGASKDCPADVIAPDGISCDDGMSCTGGDVCGGGQCAGASLTCGNGVVECGEECDDGGTAGGDDCSPTCRFEEICSDLIDNEPDGRIDCVDAECQATCQPLVNGGKPPRPSRMVLRRSLDNVRLFGAIAPAEPFDPATETFGIAISNANGVLFSKLLPAGSLGARGRKWTFRDRLARLQGGIFSVVMTRDTAAAGTVLRFTIIAYGDFTNATLPEMSVQVVLGEHAAMHTSSWTALKAGWKGFLP